MTKIAEKKTKDWWIFYPLKGLDVTDDNHDLSEPMFGDATLVSKRHVRQIVPLLRMNERMSPGHDHEADITWILENSPSKQEFQSYLAVRRAGVNDPSSNSTIESNSTFRAYQLSALLALVFFAERDFKDTCGLVEQMHDFTKSLTMLDLREGGVVWQIRGGQSYTITDSRHSIRLSKNQLREVLLQKQYASLTQALLPQKSPLPKSLRNTIAQTSITLSAALHSITPSSQLLSAVTSIELLLADLGDSYEIIRQRLATLLGSEMVTTYDAETVLRARHLYVHRGEDPKGNSIPANAIRLALYALLRYAEIASRFSGKTALIKYLDFVSKAESLADEWSEVEQEGLGKLLGRVNGL